MSGKGRKVSRIVPVEEGNDSKRKDRNPEVPNPREMREPPKTLLENKSRYEKKLFLLITIERK